MKIATFMGRIEGVESEQSLRGERDSASIILRLSETDRAMKLEVPVRVSRKLIDDRRVLMGKPVKITMEIEEEKPMKTSLDLMMECAAWVANGTFEVVERATTFDAIAITWRAKIGGKEYAEQVVVAAPPLQRVANIDAVEWNKVKLLEKALACLQDLFSTPDQRRIAELEKQVKSLQHDVAVLEDKVD